MPTKIVVVGTTVTELVDYNPIRSALSIFNLTETPAAIAGNAVIYISDQKDDATTSMGMAVAKGTARNYAYQYGDDPRKARYCSSDTLATSVCVEEEFLPAQPPPPTPEPPPIDPKMT